jgi:hypothetical protein
MFCFEDCGVILLALHILFLYLVGGDLLECLVFDTGLELACNRCTHYSFFCQLTFMNNHFLRNRTKGNKSRLRC